MRRTRLGRTAGAKESICSAGRSVELAYSGGHPCQPSAQQGPGGRRADPQTLLASSLTSWHQCPFGRPARQPNRRPSSCQRPRLTGGAGTALRLPARPRQECFAKPLMTGFAPQSEDCVPPSPGTDCPQTLHRKGALATSAIRQAGRAPPTRSVHARRFETGAGSTPKYASLSPI